MNRITALVLVLYITALTVIGLGDDNNRTSTVIYPKMLSGKEEYYRLLLGPDDELYDSQGETDSESMSSGICPTVSSLITDSHSDNTGETSDEASISGDSTVTTLTLESDIESGDHSMHISNEGESETSYREFSSLASHESGRKRSHEDEEDESESPSKSARVNGYFTQFLNSYISEDVEWNSNVDRIVTTVFIGGLLVAVAIRYRNNGNEREVEEVQVELEPAINAEAMIVDAGSDVDTDTVAKAYVVPPDTKDVPSEFDDINLDDANIRETLRNNEWTNGLQDALIKNKNKTIFRYFICDDSGSMDVGDSYKIHLGDKYDKDKRKILQRCTRWDELVASVSFHADVAKDSKSPCEFRLLNTGRPLAIGTNNPNDQNYYHEWLELLSKTKPRARETPLCRHISDVANKIRQICSVAQIPAQQYFTIIIYTDGEASDGDVDVTMTQLTGLPVKIILRLCTDEAKIVNYWKEIKDKLQLNMIIIDHIKRESDKVTKLNSWLTYAQPIHRLREWGTPITEPDDLSSRAYTLNEIRDFCKELFGVTELPDPTNFKEFIGAIKKNNTTVWNPLKRSNTELINTEAIVDPRDWFSKNFL